MIDIPKELLLTLLLRAALGGCILGVFYSVLKMFKMFFGINYPKPRNTPKSKLGNVVEFIVTFVTDIIFWIAAALFSIAILYSTSGGRFRAVIYPFMATGFVLYHLTVGRLMTKISLWVVGVLKKIVLKTVKFTIFILKLILRPFILIYRLTIGRIVGKIKEAAEVRRIMKNSLSDANVVESKPALDRKEDFIYVDGKTGYRKEGRISFGGRSDGRNRV